MQHLKLDSFTHFLKKRPADSYKGDFGHVLVIGGDEGYAGAVCLAAQAALRVGAGLVSVATHPAHTNIVTTLQPEIMCHGIRESNQLTPLLAKATVVVCGPGLGQSTWGKSLFLSLHAIPQSIVLDADALNLLAQAPLRKNSWILTPHPGEAGRLLQHSSQDVQHGRLASINALQQQYGGVVVLKGMHTLVADGADVSQCDHGNPGMATGGMGDVLSGVIGGLLAQQLSLIDAAKLGVLVHALAGDDAAKAGERGMVASDLLPFLRKRVNLSHD